MAYNKYKVNSNLEGGMKLKVNNTRGHEIIIDEPESMGGTDDGMNPVEVTLASLAGCLSITAVFLAKKMKIKIDDLSIDVEGEIDKEAMTSTEVDSDFKKIRYNINIKSDSSEEKIKKLIESIGDYCPVSDTLIRAIDVKGDYQLN